MLLVPSSWFVVVALHSGHTTKKINITIQGRNAWVLTSAFTASNSWSLKADRCKSVTAYISKCTSIAAFITCSMKLADCNQRLASFPGPTQPENEGWLETIAAENCILYCKWQILLRPRDKAVLHYQCDKLTFSTAFFWVFREVTASLLLCISWITVETCVFWLSTKIKYN